MYGIYLNSISVFLLLSVYLVLSFLQYHYLMFKIAEMLLKKNENKYKLLKKG